MAYAYMSNRDGVLAGEDGFIKVKRLGRGAFGEAVLYRRVDDDLLVVLKQVSLAGEYADKRRAEAIKESETLAMLNHCNIITYFDSFVEDDNLLIEMEYADNGSLREKIVAAPPNSRFPEELIKWYAFQITSAIEHIHGIGILHRDIKSENIFLTRSDIVKVGDFGISKVLTGPLDTSNTVVGTPYYMAPELLMGKPYCEKIDIFALGCIIHELALKRRTYEATNMPAMLTKIVNSVRDQLPAVYSEGLQDTIDMCLHSNPTQRPTATQLLVSGTFCKDGRTRRQMEEEVEQLCQSIDVGRHASRTSSTETRGSDASGHGRTTPMSSSSGVTSRMTLETTLLGWGAGGVPRPVDVVFGCGDKPPVPTRMATGGAHAAIVTNEDELYTWCLPATSDIDGYSSGQLGHGDVTSHRKPKRVMGALAHARVQDVGCGSYYTACLTQNGAVYTFGSNEFGTLGLGHEDEGEILVPQIMPLDASIVVRALSCGPFHAALCTHDRRAYTWGCGESGRLGLGDEDDRMVPAQVLYSPQYVTSSYAAPGTKHWDVTAVSAGSEGTLFLTGGGKVYGAGDNCDNRLGLNKVGTLIHSFRAHQSSTQGLEDGTVPGSVNSSAFPRPVFALRSHRASFVSIFCGMHHSAAIDVGGKLYLFGANHHGQLGTGKYRPVPGAHQVKMALQGETVTMVTCGPLHTVAVTARNQVFSWGQAAAGASLGRLEVSPAGGSKSSMPQLVEGADFHRVRQVVCGEIQTYLISDRLVNATTLVRAGVSKSVLDTGRSTTRESSAADLSKDSGMGSDDGSSLGFDLSNVDGARSNPDSDMARYRHLTTPSSTSPSSDLGEYVSEHQHKSTPRRPFDTVGSKSAAGPHDGDADVDSDDSDDLERMPWLAAELADAPVYAAVDQEPPCSPQKNSGEESGRQGNECTDSEDEMDAMPWLAAELAETAIYARAAASSHQSTSPGENKSTDRPLVAKPTGTSSAYLVRANARLRAMLVEQEATIVALRARLHQATIVPSTRLGTNTQQVGVE